MGQPLPTGIAIGDRVLSASGDTHPLWSLAHARLGAYLIAGASAAGAIHLEHGRPRDDAFVVRSAGHWIAVGVADGVGSRSLSRYGATYVAESLSAHLLRALAPRPRPEPRDPQRRKSTGVRTPLPSLAAFEEYVLAQAGSRPEAPVTQFASVAWSAFTAFEPPAATLQSVRDEKSDDGTVPPAGELDPAPAVNQADAPSDPDVAPPVSETTEADGEEVAPAAVDRDPSLDEVMLRAFERTHAGLRDYARHLDLDVAELSSTALGLLLNVESGVGAAGQVGDGALVGLCQSGAARELVVTADGDDPQSVHTINRTRWREHFAQSQWVQDPADPLVALFVMTDGISNDVLYSASPTALGDWARGVDRNLRLAASPAQAAAAMLNWIATYQVQGSWDDRTLVVLTQQERTDGDGDAAPR